MDAQQLNHVLEPLAQQLAALSESEQQAYLARWADELGWAVRFSQTQDKLARMAAQAFDEDAEGVDLEAFLNGDEEA